jgi:hypothetical protein
MPSIFGGLHEKGFLALRPCLPWSIISIPHSDRDAWMTIPRTNFRSRGYPERNPAARGDVWNAPAMWLDMQFGENSTIFDELR